MQCSDIKDSFEIEHLLFSNFYLKWVIFGLKFQNQLLLRFNANRLNEVIILLPGNDVGFWYKKCLAVGV